MQNPLFLAFKCISDDRNHQLNKGVKMLGLKWLNVAFSSNLCLKTRIQEKTSWLKAFFIDYNNSWQHISITKPLYKYKKKKNGVKKTIKLFYNKWL